MGNLFAYGTLMCVDIMEEVAGIRPSHQSAILRHYSRRSVEGEFYPAVIPHEPGLVEGVVYLGIPGAAWKRLDRFEGELYERRLVTIELRDGGTLPAATYVARPDLCERLEPHEWDYAAFLRRDKALFRRDYRGYRAL
jgi:gamma-glutamylcyclotransferase (GGCT)/AIG2-like uncharacterized protein YtfP